MVCVQSYFLLILYCCLIFQANSRAHKLTLEVSDLKRDLEETIYAKTQTMMSLAETQEELQDMTEQSKKTAVEMKECKERMSYMQADLIEKVRSKAELFDTKELLEEKTEALDSK